MSKKNFTKEHKAAVLKSAEKINVREAAKIKGVHYTTVYDCRRQFEILGMKAFLEYQVSTGLKNILR